MTISATSGVADVQARITAIRSRSAAISPTPVRGDAAVLDPASFPSTAARTPSAGPSPITVATSSTVSTPGGGSTPAATQVPAPSGAWVDRLPPEGRRIAGWIDRAAREAGVEPALLAALVKHESGFDPDARSHAGAIGLAQLMPGTAAGLGVDPTDPLDNLRGGARYLREQLDRFGGTELALAAYNAGPGRVSQAGGIPRITETRNYVDRVMNSWRSWQ